MADNIDVDPGTGASKLPVATDDCGAAGHIQRIKLDIGGNGASSPVVAGNGLPGNLIQVNGVAPSVGNGTSGTGVLRVTVASDSTGVLNVGGRAAHNASPSGNPVLGAGVASTSVPSAVTAGNVARQWVDTAGAVVTKDRPTATSSVTSVNASATSVSLLASTNTRLFASFFNDSTDTLYLKFGATASTTSFTVKILAGGYFEMPYPYTGAIDGIWSGTNGAVRITELT